MTRGGRTKRRDEPVRRCIATGESGPRDRMIRFVLDPEARVTPDLAERLPGHGAWLTADRGLVDKAVRKRLFARAFRAAVTVPEDLAALLERLLVERLTATLALARKAGQAVTGFEKTRERLVGRRAGLLVQACDGAPDGRRRLARLAADLPRVEVLDARELGLAFGREFAVHAALDAGGFAARAHHEATRLAGFRAGAPTQDGPSHDRTGSAGSRAEETGRSGSRVDPTSDGQVKTEAHTGPRQDSE